MDIKEGNKLIAEFMGHSLSGGIWYMPDYSHYAYKGTHSFKIDCFKTEQLSYNSSWDWLMPVVERIETISIYQAEQYGSFPVSFAFLKVLNNYVVIVSCAALKFNQIKMENAIRLTATHEAVIEFIKWYNKNKTS